MSRIQLRNVWMEYGAHVVLERVNLDIAHGEFCTVVGASGCGKTSFLRLLLGQERPSRGHILLDDQPLPDEPDADRGVVFQRYSVFPHLTVLENVLLGLELRAARWTGRLFGAARRHACEQALAMLERVGLAAARDQYPQALSGGMQQRLALAQSLICRPKVLLLDEPFGALDPGIRSGIHQLVRELWEQHQITIVLVTHDLSEGFALGTRLLVFDKQRVDPQEPYAYGASITYDIPLGKSSDKGSTPLPGRGRPPLTVQPGLAEA